jgi:AraC-like DNA-binding protein
VFQALAWLEEGGALGQEPIAPPSALAHLVACVPGTDGRGCATAYYSETPQTSYTRKMAKKMGDQPAVLQFLRDGSLPGVELVDVLNTSQNWQCYATAFELVVPRSWRADMAYKQQQFALREGAVFCAEPGELFKTSGIQQVGDVSVLCIPQEAVLEHLSERRGKTAVDVDSALRVLVDSGSLQRNIENLRGLMRTTADPLQLQSAYYDVLDSLVANFDGEPLPASLPNPTDDATARRVKEWLDEEPARRVDLYVLAKETGRSRYQVLRAFKRLYGLPPHAYQLCVRIARAQDALLHGESPAQVAVRYGFVDQSHFSKHFRRLVGVTPASYARKPFQSYTSGVSALNAE